MKLTATTITFVALLVGGASADEESTKSPPAPGSAATPESAVARPTANTDPAATGKSENKTSRRSNAGPSPLLVAKEHRFHPVPVRELLDRWLADGLVRVRDASNGEPVPDLALTLSDAAWGAGDRASAALLQVSELRIPTVSITFPMSKRTDGKTPQPAATLSIGPRVEWEAARSIVEAFARNGISTKVDRRPTLSLWFVSSSFSSPDNEEMKSVVDELGLKVHKEHPLQLRTEVLFPENAAAIYEPQKAAQLLKWLKVRKLVFEEVPSTEQSPSRVTRLPVAAEQNNGLVKRTSTWSWQASTHISPALQPGIEIQRALTVTEDWRGKAGPGDPAVAYTSFSVPVEPGKVAIVHAFPIFDGQNDPMFAAVPAAHRKENYIALLIIQNNTLEQSARPLLTDSDEPKLLVPDSGVPVRLFPGMRSGNAFAADFQVPSRLVDAQRRVFELHNLPRTSDPDAASEENSQKFSLQFKSAPWPDVLESLSEKVGLTLDLRSTPPGTVGLEDPSLYSPTEAIDRLNEQLVGKGHILIPRDRTLICLNFEKEPVTRDLVPSVTVDDLPARGQYELLSVTIPIPVGDIKEVAKDLEQVKGPAGSVVPLVSENSIVVTDLGESLRRMARMVQAVSLASNKRWLEVYQVRSADSGEVAKSLDALLPGVVVNEDSDAKRIHVMGTARQHEQVRQQIARIDASQQHAEGTATAPSATHSTTHQTKIIKLQHARASSMVHLLSQVIRANGFAAAADERTNSILVTAPDDGTANLVEAILEKLDSEPPVRDPSNPLARLPSGPAVAAKPLEDLKKHYAEREAAAAAVAAQLRTQLESIDGQSEDVTRYASNEFFNQIGRNETTFVNELHKATLGRPAKPEELTYWIGRFKSLNGYRSRFVREYFAAIRPGTPASGTNNVLPKEAALREKLTAAVNEAFAARQKMLAAELAALEARIVETRRAIELRERIADKIVAQRVEELVSPNYTGQDTTRLTRSGVTSSVGSDNRNVPESTSDRKPRRLIGAGLDFYRARKLVEDLGIKTDNFQSHGEGTEFQFYATDEEYQRFQTAVEAEAAEVRREKDARDQARRLSLLTGIWDRTDSGDGVGPDAPRLVIDGELAATFEGTQRKRLWGAKSDAEGHYTFSALDGQSSMDGTYDQTSGAEALRLVSIGQKGAEIVGYTRAIGVVPVEWTEEMQKEAANPSAKLKPIEELVDAKRRANDAPVRRAAQDPTPQDITTQLTGIWETGPGLDMMGMEGDMGGMAMGMAPAMGGGMGMMSGAAGPRLVIYGDRAALYDKNEQKRLWRIEVERSGRTLLHFIAQDDQAGMQGVFDSLGHSLTIVSTGEDGARIVRYRKTVSAVPPEWAKRMQAGGKAEPPAVAAQRQTAPPLWPAGSAEAELLSNLTGIWTSRPMMGAYGEMGMGMGAFSGMAMDPAMAGSPQTTFLVMHAGRAALYEKNERKRSWSIAVEQIDETQARLNFVPADAKSGMQGSYTLKKGGLTVVSAGEEGPMIEHYSRVAPIVPPEWAAAMEAAAPISDEAPANPKPSDEHLRGTAGYATRTAPAGNAGSGRNPSDYLELLKSYQPLLDDYERLLESVGKNHPQARKLQQSRQFQEIEILRQEFQAELDAAAAQVDLKRAELSAARIKVDRARLLLKQNAMSKTEHEQQEAALQVAEAQLQVAESRLKLFETTKDKIFPKHPPTTRQPSPEGDDPAASPPPAAPSPAAPSAKTPAPTTPKAAAAPVAPPASAAAPADADIPDEFKTRPATPGPAAAPVDGPSPEIAPGPAANPSPTSETRPAAQPRPVG